MPPPHEVLRPPAIALIVVAAVNLLVGGLALVSFAINPSIGRSPTGDLGATATSVSFQLLALIEVATAPLIAAGGIQMLRVRSLALVRAAAVLAMIPGVSCCFVVGIPAGIWTIAVLNWPRVIDAFEE